MVMMRVGRRATLKTTVKMMMAQPQLPMPCFTIKRKQQVERLGDDRPKAELDERFEGWTVRLAVSADGMDR